MFICDILLIDKIKDNSNKELINLLKEYNISDRTIMMTLLGIGTHTAYYKVLYNRIQNNKDKMNESFLKKLVIEIFHEIDREEE